jgi:DNA-binding transcriptional regulator YiaG
MGNMSARAITFSCKTVPNIKDLQKLDILEISIIRKKRKISSHVFKV